MKWRNLKFEEFSAKFPGVWEGIGSILVHV